MAQHLATYTVAEVADLLRLNVETVRRRIRAKDIQAIPRTKRSESLRIPASEVDRLLGRSTS